MLFIYQLRFNKEFYSIYTCFSFEVFAPLYDYVLTRSPDWVCGLICICIYAFLRETNSSCNSLVLSFWRETNLSWSSSFYSFFTASIWKRHTLFTYYMYCIEERNFSQENPWYNILYLNRNNRTVKNLFIVCLLLKIGINTTWSPLIPLFSITFLWEFIYLTIFHFVLIFNGFIVLVIDDAISRIMILDVWFV